LLCCFYGPSSAHRRISTAHPMLSTNFLRNVAVEFAFLRNVPFLLWCDFRRILIARYVARSEFSASDLILRKSWFSHTIVRDGVARPADGSEYYPPLPKQDTDIFEVLISQMGECREIEPILGKTLCVLGISDRTCGVNSLALNDA
jgi:hypothetical protein